MVLTIRQKKQLAALPKSQRAALANKFERDNRTGPQPKRAARPPPKPKARSAPQRSRVRLNPLSPWNSLVPPTLMNMGRGVPIIDRVSASTTSSTTTVRILCFGMNSGTSTVGVRIDNAATGGNPVVFNLPRLALTTANGGPISARASKLGLRIRCTTKSQDVMNSIWCLRTSSKRNWPVTLSLMTGTQIGQLYDEVLNNPHSIELTNKTLTRTHEMFSNVRDDSDYNNFVKWDGPLDNLTGTPNAAAGADLFQLILGNLTLSNVTYASPAPLDFLFVAIPVCATTQSFTFSVTAQMVCRFDDDHIAASLHQQLPTAGSSVINDSRLAAEVLGDVRLATYVTETTGNPYLGAAAGVAAVGVEGLSSQW